MSALAAEGSVAPFRPPYLSWLAPASIVPSVFLAHHFEQITVIIMPDDLNGLGFGLKELVVAIHDLHATLQQCAHVGFRRRIVQCHIAWFNGLHRIAMRKAIVSKDDKALDLGVGVLDVCGTLLSIGPLRPLWRAILQNGLFIRCARLIASDADTNAKHQLQLLGGRNGLRLAFLCTPIWLP
jgi:hypothetical protein